MDAARAPGCSMTLDPNMALRHGMDHYAHPQASTWPQVEEQATPTLMATGNIGLQWQPSPQMSTWSLVLSTDHIYQYSLLGQMLQFKAHVIYMAMHDHTKIHTNTKENISLSKFSVCTVNKSVPSIHVYYIHRKPQGSKLGIIKEIYLFGTYFKLKIIIVS